MEGQITSKKFAELTGRSPRTVQGWVEDKKGIPQDVPGVVRIGRAFAATRQRWEEIAASKGTQGRRDREPRTKKDNPGSTSQ